MTWLTVTTPVPPMPTMRTVKSSASTIGSAGGGHVDPAEPVGALAPWSPARVSMVTVANDGQSPCRQEKSKLQLVWWIRVLRPNGVSTGCTDRQLLLSPQSPHPSQIRSLMTTRKPGVAIVPRARPASILGGAGLVVDQHGDAAASTASVVERLVEPAAIPHLDAGGNALR